MLGISKNKKKLRGMDLIDEVAGRFTAMVDELEEGISDCKNEQTGISSQIESLVHRNDILDLSVQRASEMSKNLNKLVGE